MRGVVQRVRRARVIVEGGAVAGEIGLGSCVLVGVAEDDDAHDADLLAAKVADLRIFPDDGGLMNRSVAEAGGSVLVVSQFTLLGDARRGRRPSFARAAAAPQAEALYERVATNLREVGLPVETGIFGAAMQVELVNDGPVTILLDTKQAF
jgi:D-tyrosyl-tRNA(Tyr) deacylase